MQSADDPSLVLPASDIWDGVATGWGGGPGSSGPGIGYPEEELLTGLGRASRLFPELDAELRTAAPAAVSLDTAGAWKFVREAGPLLSGAGFGVLLPDWARQRRLGLRISARSTPAAPGSTATGKPMFGLADLVDFRYELALGDVPLDPGRAGRAGPAQGAAGPAARPVGRADDRPAQGRRSGSWSGAARRPAR